MLTATLGGLIKDYRIKKRLSQLEVSLRFGWRDTTRLSKIEQGRVGKPTRKTIEKVIAALDLNEQERGEFLLAGGYLPDDEEIKNALKEIRRKIDNWPYPAYVMDFAWRLLDSNVLNLKVLNLPLKLRKEIQKTKPSALIFPFLPREQFSVEVMKGEDSKHLKPFKIAQIAAFKGETFRYQNENWYQKTIQQLTKNGEFRRLWSNVGNADYYKQLLDYEYKTITGKYGNQRLTLHFHIFTARLIRDPRFQIVLYTPANKETLGFIEKIFPQNSA